MKFEVTLKELQIDGNNGESFEVDLGEEIIQGVKDQIYFKLRQDIVQKIDKKISETIKPK